MMSLSEYEESINWLYDLQYFGMKLGLSNTRALLEEMANPHDKFKSIHVAGSNGKGSVCAFLTSILMQEGKKVGTYTSPHLRHFGERVCINRFPMTRTETVRAINHIRPKIERLGEQGIQCTFFEAVTCLAFHHFARRRVDIAVVEVGMGGRLDSTNVITPELSIITNISREHSQHLGETVEEIAGEKAGIIKKGVPVVANAAGPAMMVIKEKCKQQDAGLYDASKLPETEIFASDLFGSDVRIKTKENDFSFRSPLPGLHQAENAASAVLSAEIMGMGPETIISGLEDAGWPARLQMVRTRPRVMLDSTHNPGGAETLAAYIGSLGITPWLIIGMLEDKDAEAVAEKIKSLAKRIVVSAPDYHRAMEIGKLASFFSGKVEKSNGLGMAIDDAMSEAGMDDLILITGSIFTASDALAHLERIRIHEIMDILGEAYGIGAYPGRDPETDGPPPPGSQDPFRVLVSTILSQRTKDENTHIATEQLFAAHDTPEKLASVKPEEIYRLIRPAGFYKQKAEKIVLTSGLIHEKYGSRVPDTMEELVSLPGVGRKTASCVLAYGFGKPAIAVDTHVHRISNLLGLVRTSKPDDTEEELMFLVPRERWHDINRLLVRHGQSICAPINPRCAECPISHVCYHGLLEING